MRKKEQSPKCHAKYLILLLQEMLRKFLLMWLGQTRAFSCLLFWSAFIFLSGTQRRTKHSKVVLAQEVLSSNTVSEKEESQKHLLKWFFVFSNDRKCKSGNRINFVEKSHKVISKFFIPTYKSSFTKHRHFVLQYLSLHLLLVTYQRW